ncbi:hypothetical protein UFOVP257_350 [uncultured Caudovirales phage]|uniref:Uncharacterized protein n=1 Tax=uncultured Caudovirales phage TaxID=2100421 RepID=A0A6J5LG02_9CAUD|nr:hypothetical protein UFOVP257_350 [uncultured Caudovirales phage]
MRDLLESMDKFAGQSVGQKPGDQVRGSEPMPKKGGGKKHPYAGRLVGGCSESENIEESLRQEYEQYLAEYGTPGTVIPSEIGVDPKELAAGRMQRSQQKQEASQQVQNIQMQINALRGQLASLNSSFPQGANPAEKAMTLKQMQGQRNDIISQIEDLTAQLVSARQAAL